MGQLRLTAQTLLLLSMLLKIKVNVLSLKATPNESLRHWGAKLTSIHWRSLIAKKFESPRQWTQISKPKLSPALCWSHQHQCCVSLYFEQRLRGSDITRIIPKGIHTLWIRESENSSSCSKGWSDTWKKSWTIMLVHMAQPVTCLCCPKWVLGWCRIPVHWNGCNMQTIVNCRPQLQGHPRSPSQKGDNYIYHFAQEVKMK